MLSDRSNQPHSQDVTDDDPRRPATPKESATDPSDKSLPQQGDGASSGRQAASYTRYSSEHQDERSLRDQQRKCEDRAAKDGNKITREFRDAAISGAKHNRPGFQQLLEACRNGLIAVIYLESLSRLARDMLLNLRTLAELVYRHKVRIVSIDDGFDTNTEGWELLGGIHGFQNQNYLRTLGKQVRRGQEGVVHEGLCIGDTRFGYGSEPVDDNSQPARGDRKQKRRYFVLEEEASWVRKIFTWYVEDHWSHRKIAKELNKRGVKRDHRAQTDTWNPNVVRSLLSCPKYKGQWEWGVMQNFRDPLTGKTSQRERPEGSESRIQRHIPELAIVDEATFNRAAIRLAENQKKYAGWRGEKGRLHGSSGNGFHSPKRHLLAGAVECRACGARMVVWGKYLKCSNSLKVSCDCKTQLQMEWAEKIVLDQLSAQLLDEPGLVDHLEELVEKLIKRSARDLPEERSQLTKRLDDVKSRTQRLIDMCETGEVPEFRERLTHLRAEKLQLELRLDELKAEGETPVDKPPREWVVEKLSHLRELLAGDVTAANQVLSSLLHDRKITVWEVRQPGKARKALHGRFAFDRQALLHLICQDLTATGLKREEGEHDEPDWFECNFTVPPPFQRHADEVTRLWKEGYQMKVIGEKLGLSQGPVQRAFAYWHEQRGLPTPDCRNGRPKPKLSTHAEQLQEKMMTMFRDGKLIVEIANALGCCMETVRRHLEQWHERHGLPMPDGRNRRKGLDRKTRGGKKADSE